MKRSEHPTETPSERESLEVAEAARQTEWTEPSFLKELFLGRFRLDLIHPFPGSEERAEFREFYEKFRTFLRENVDPVEIDATGEYPPELIDGLKRIGAFGMKIPREYGGLGLSASTGGPPKKRRSTTASSRFHFPKTWLWKPAASKFCRTIGWPSALGEVTSIWSAAHSTKTRRRNSSDMRRASMR